ncbi:MAG: LL-diaminopimelate aminotransferase [Clostridiales bacterium]|nr:LL-diaminopimelate aminotransferase [Clostridiales bacterium]
MAKLNENYLNIKQSYLFSEIAKRVNDFCDANPDKKVIRLGIGDVTLPLGSLVIDALHKAVDEMSKAETFKGYGPEQGYDFLRNSIKEYYKRNGVEVDLDEIFVSDGAKSDTGNITDMFSTDNVVLVPDPVYPVYVDTNIMNGRKIIYMDGTAENGFLPMPDDSVKADIIYLCSPNNPTGAVYNKEQLKAWVDYANKNDAIILFDSAYECFVAEPGLPRSIFSIEGAKTCCVEFCSLSKTAGFTGTRCGYTVVPKAIVKKTSDGRELSLNHMWNRRQTTKFNGVPYIIQRGAAAVFTEEGMDEAKAMINTYRKNAKLISDTMDELGVKYTGGINSPYIWFECPFGMYSWDFFDKMLNEIQVVGTLGAGFGKNGDNYFRLTSFNNYENTKEAMERFKTLFK